MSTDDATTTVPARPAGIRAVLRVLVVSLCMLYIWGSPAAKQFFGLRHPYVRSWQMFNGEGLDATELSWWRVDADGTRVPLDRAALADAGVKLKKFPTNEDAKKAAAKLCRSFGPGADVRYCFRQATRRGWDVKASGNKNMCGEVAP